MLRKMPRWWHFLLCWFCLSVRLPAQPVTAEDFFDRARDHFERRRFLNTLDSLRVVLQMTEQADARTTPLKREAEILAAQSLASLGRRDEAANMYERAIFHGYSDKSALAYLGIYFDEHGQWQSAAATPSASDRGLADWPLARYDLATLLPPRGGPPVFVGAQLETWAGLIANVPDLGKLAERVKRLLATADRLMALAHVPGDDAAQLRRAAEGALISAYLAAAQVAIWPVAKGTGGVAAKKRVAKAIDDRACRNDPTHMQAAIRMMFEEASWLARLVGGDRMVTGMPVWIEIV